MHCRRIVLGGVLLIALGTGAWAKTPVRPAVELDALLGPVALYPDPLLAQMLPAATVPDDLERAVKYLEDGGELGQVDAQPWTDNAKALARWPEVLRMMNRSRDWTDALGAAFLDQPKDVMDSIQRLRAAALASGALQTTNEQRVAAEKGIVYIYPADPTAMQLPQYDPNAVFIQSPSSGGVPGITFGSVLLVGYWLNYELDWRKRRVYSYDYQEYPYGRRNPWYFGGENTGEVPPNLPRQRNQEWKPDRKRVRPHANLNAPLPTIQTISEPAAPLQENEPAKPMTESRPLAAPKDIAPPPPMLVPVDPEMEPVEEASEAKPAAAKPGVKKPAAKKSVPAKAVKAKPAAAAPAKAASTPAKPAKAKPAAQKSAPAKTGKAKPAEVKAPAKKAVKDKPAPAKSVKAPSKKKQPAPAKPGTAKSTETKPSTTKQP
jgi:hypothetical protein